MCVVLRVLLALSLPLATPPPPRDKTRSNASNGLCSWGLSGVLTRTEGLLWPSAITERNWVTFWWSDLLWVPAGLTQSSGPFDHLKVGRTVLFRQAGRQASSRLTARREQNHPGWCLSLGVDLHSFFKWSYAPITLASNPARSQVGPAWIFARSIN